MTLQEIDALEDEIFGDARLVWTNAGFEGPITVRQLSVKTILVIERFMDKMRRKAASLLASIRGDLIEIRPD